MKKTGLLIFAFVLMAFQCSRETQDPVINQDVLFARIYENYAWGHQLKGWFIDHDGRVRGFSLYGPEMDWKPIHDGGLIPESDLLDDLSLTDTTYLTIPGDDLLHYFSYISAASHGTLTDKQSQGNDMGQVSNYGLIYFPQDREYKFILLESRGDWMSRNVSPEAGKINAWMDSISLQIDFPPVPDR